MPAHETYRFPRTPIAERIMTQPPPTDSPATETPAEPPRFDSHELFQGSRVVVINHAGETYRLLLTRNNRLILQK